MCDSVVAVGSETSDGATLFAKNSDRKPLECQPFVQHAAAHHPPRARVRCTHIEIPEVAETYRLMGHSPAWVWGFEHGVNEHGVAIGNHTIFSKEPIEEEPGLIGMDLVRLGLERGRDAREALEVIATLIETHGMGGPALAPDGAGYHNSFALADPTSAWVLEASNRRWAARRVSRTACSNHMAIGSDWEIASRDLENHARCEGWWREDTRVDVSAAYRNHHIPEHITSGRQRQAQGWIDERRGQLDVPSLQALLRDHGDGSPGWSRVDATPEEECFFTVCAHSAPVHVTTASLVAALPAERPGPWPVWVSFGTPCSSVFLPVYLDGVIPAALARDGHPGDGAWSHFKHLQDAVAEDPVPRTRRVREGFAGLEAEIEAERVAVERSARTAAVARDLDYAADIVTRFMERSVESALVRADELAASLARD
jgi:dipeptidase